MIRRPDNPTGDPFESGEPFDRALRNAYEDARDAHRRDGAPMVFWRDGRVVWVDPETLEEVPEPEFAKRRD